MTIINKTDFVVYLVESSLSAWRFEPSEPSEVHEAYEGVATQPRLAYEIPFKKKHTVKYSCVAVWAALAVHLLTLLQPRATISLPTLLESDNQMMPAMTAVVCD